MGDRDFIFKKSPTKEETIWIIVSKRSFRTARWFQGSYKKVYAFSITTYAITVTNSDNPQRRIDK
jgi:hypothetical protein